MRDGTGTEAFHCTFVKIWFLKHSNVLPLSKKHTFGTPHF